MEVVISANQSRPKRRRDSAHTHGPRGYVGSVHARAIWRDSARLRSSWSCGWSWVSLDSTSGWTNWLLQNRRAMVIAGGGIGCQLLRREPGGQLSLLFAYRRRLGHRSHRCAGESAFECRRREAADGAAAGSCACRLYSSQSSSACDQSLERNLAHAVGRPDHCLIASESNFAGRPSTTANVPPNA